MFAWWGRTVYRYRYIVIGVMVALCLGGGVFGISLGQHVTQSGFYDDGSESAQASRLADEVYGRDTSGHIVAIYTAPEGKTVDDPAFQQKVLDNLAQAERDHPDEILRSIGYFKSPDTLANMADGDKQHAFMSIQLKGDNDDTILNNFKKVQDDFNIPGVDVKLAGLQPLANELTGTIGEDQKRGEVLAIPLVAVVLFFVFGGVVAASLPAIVGGLTIAGALGIMRLLAEVMPVHFFAQPVVTLIGLGIAIDYGLFIVSRFREEIAEGYDTEAAVRRSVMTSGRTVTFSAVIIVASSVPLLLFPQDFLKSITYAMIATVMLSAILSITVLPATLAILGTNVDAFGVRTLLRVPFFRNWGPMNWWLNWLADKTQKTKTREEVEKGFWGKLVNRVMKRPIAFAAPILVLMILLIVPLGQLALGGISEKYLPPDNSVRQAQEEFDRIFPGFRTEPLTLVIRSENGQPVTDQQIAEVRNEAHVGVRIHRAGQRSRQYVEGTPVPRRRVKGPVGAGDPERPGEPRRRGAQDRRTAGTLAAARPDGVGGRHTRPGTGQHPQPVQQAAVDGGAADHHDHHPDVPGVRIPGPADQGRPDERVDSRVDDGRAHLDIRRRPLLSLAQLHAAAADGPDDRLDHRGDLRPVDRLRSLPGLPHGGGPRTRHVHRGGHPNRHRDHRSAHHRGGLGPGRGGRRVRLLRSRDDEVPGVRPAHRATAGRDRHPDVPGARRHEAAGRRLLVGAALDEAAAGAARLGEIDTARRAQTSGGARARGGSRRRRRSVRPRPVPPHDPTHPGVEGSSRPGATTRIKQAAPRANGPSVVGTTRMPTPRSAPADEPPTTRLSMAKNAVRNVVHNATAVTQRHQRPTPPQAPAPTPAPPAAPPPAPAPTQPREDREIESWLGELRGTSPAGPPMPPPHPQPSADATRAIPTGRSEATRGSDAEQRQRRPQGDDAPTAKQRPPDPEATEKLNTRKGDDERKPRGSGVSAQDLLRREGRL